MRAEKVWARAVDLDGNPVRFKGVDDLLAQALEHEFDHLNGVLFIDFLRSNEDLYEIEVGHEEDGDQETDEASEDSASDAEAERGTAVGANRQAARKL